MDLQKTKIYLDKLNREFARMTKDPDTIVRLDVDIMASYVRELYDAILSAEPQPAIRHQEPAPARKPARAPEPVETPPPPVVAAPPPVVVPPPPVVVAPPVVETPPQVVVETPPPAPAPAPAPPVVLESPKTSDVPPAGIDLLFEEKQAKELSEKLSELPIPDLKKAIALNDRLLLTSELFAGDGKAFESAITHLNHLSGFEEAQQYLVDHCVVRYAWTDKKRLEVAKNFIKLVRRRFK